MSKYDKYIKFTTDKYADENYESTPAMERVADEYFRVTDTSVYLERKGYWWHTYTYQTDDLYDPVLIEIIEREKEPLPLEIITWKKSTSIKN
jgi:hypothetical protein